MKSISPGPETTTLPGAASAGSILRDRDDGDSLLHLMSEPNDLLYDLNFPVDLLGGNDMKDTAPPPSICQEFCRSFISPTAEGIQKGESAVGFMFNGKGDMRVYRVQCVMKGGN